MQKSKRLSEKALQIAAKRREAKSKGEKERYKHLNAEFQRIARKDKKAFLSDQCREREENNRMDHKKLWKILKEMGIPDHLTCLLRNKKQQLELDMEQQTGSK